MLRAEMRSRKECLERAAHYEALAAKATSDYAAGEYRKLAARWRERAERMPDPDKSAG